MARDDWFRRTSWTAEDREDFFSRLKRSRSKKAQYLRIQAVHLADAGLHAAAIELLDEFFTHDPEKWQLALAHKLKAECLVSLDRHQSAIDEFRSSLQVEREFPKVHSGSWLSFAWFVVRWRKAELYEQARHVLDDFEIDNRLVFPADQYRYAAVRALLAEADGNTEAASEFAKMALHFASCTHSGFRYHPHVGLVREVDPEIHDRLIELIAVPVHDSDDGSDRSSASNRHRIAFCITELDPGGAERQLVRLVTNVDRALFAPEVICLAGPGPLVEPLQKAGIHVTSQGFPILRNFL